MPIQITQTNQAQQLGEKVAIFGGAGSGKTRLLATAPAPIIIAAERNGSRSISDFAIPEIKTNSYAEAWEAIKYLQTPDAQALYATVGVDSISEIAEQHIAAIKPQHKNLMQAYGQLADDMIPLVKAFLDLPMNVVLLAKVGQHTDNVSGVTKFTPLFPGNAVGELFPHLIDAIWYLGVEQSSAVEIPGQQPSNQRLLYTGATQRFDCKDRSLMLESVYGVPEMPYGTNSSLLTNLFNTMKNAAPVA